MVGYMRDRGIDVDYKIYSTLRAIESVDKMVIGHVGKRL
jgi:hypothetical protein